MTTIAVAPRESALHMSWSAIFGGAVVTLGIWMLLHSLGLAAGLTAINPEDQGSIRGIGIGTGVWSVIAPLLALFAGGFVAAYTAGLLDRTSGIIHGVVVWGLTTVAGAVLLAMALAATVRAGMQMGMSAVSGGAGVAAVAGASADQLGLDFDQALVPINQRLQQQGLPPVTAQQMRAATQETFNRALREGRLDRNMLASAVANNTGMSNAEANQLAQQLQTQFDQRASELQNQARTTALAAADKAGKAFWGVFLALLLGALSAAAGGVLGMGRGIKRVVLDEPPATSPVSPPPRQIPIQGRS
ncbi:MAG TPA: hypothetical protein VGG33_02900 [Polyangia bacterium]